MENPLPEAIFCLLTNNERKIIQISSPEYKFSLVVVLLVLFGELISFVFLLLDYTAVIVIRIVS